MNPTEHEAAVAYARAHGWTPELRRRPASVEARFLRPGDRTDLAGHVSRISDADLDQTGGRVTLHIDGAEVLHRMDADAPVTIYIL